MEVTKGLQQYTCSPQCTVVKEALWLYLLQSLEGPGESNVFPVGHGSVPFQDGLIFNSARSVCSPARWDGVRWCCEVPSVSRVGALGRKTGQRQALVGVAAGFGLAQEGFPLNTRCTTPGEPRRGTQTYDQLKCQIQTMLRFLTCISSSYIFILRSVFFLDLRPWYTRDTCCTQQNPRWEAAKWKFPMKRMGSQECLFSYPASIHGLEDTLQRAYGGWSWTSVFVELQRGQSFIPTHLYFKHNAILI